MTSEMALKSGPQTTARQTRRELMACRNAALTAKDYATFHAITRALARLPMEGVSELTQRDIARYNANKDVKCDGKKGI